jgi:hypothetical protein
LTTSFGFAAPIGCSRPVIGSTARNRVSPFDGKAATSALLESKTVAVKCLAAASLVCPIGRQPPSSLSDCHKSLVAAGFAPSDATWVIARDDGTLDFHALRSKRRGHEAVLFAFDPIGRNGDDQRRVSMIEAKISRNSSG